MTRWTDSAKAKLEEYFTQMRGHLAASGADADEVTEDLRRHIDEEVAARKLTVVTEQDVGPLLARLGAPEGGTTVAEPPPGPARAQAADGRADKPPGWWLLIFGVLLPAAAIAFEFVSGACAGLFFDPLPTYAHVVLTAFVPVANLLVWLALRSGELRRRRWLGWANGVAIGVALAYAVVFLPLSACGAVSVVMIMGLVLYGIGLAPLAPLSALICAWMLRRHLHRAGGAEARLPGLWRGLALGLLALAAFTLPSVLTNVGLDMAASDSPAESTRGVRLLRWWGQDEELLRVCYGRSSRSGDAFSWGRPIGAEAARAIYYRVHGEPFNSVPPPKLYAGRARWDVMEQEFTWDNDQGGDTVAGRVRGLSLVHSRQDAVVEPEAALAYIEWTLEFQNDSPLQRESRAQIVLPPGGLVSRLTLWIDGEEREAAFGGRSQVKTAYKEVVNQRRDPVLVTTCGPDRVLMQCFPVPANGGKMKVRLGITAPLVLTAADTGCLRWPAFAERNFTIGAQLQHSVWAESPLALETRGGRLKSEAGKDGRAVLRGQLSDTELSAPTNVVRARRPANARDSWTRDSRQEKTPFIHQTIVERAVTPPDRVVVVVDGTKGMETYWRSICGGLSQLPTNVSFALLLARDGCEELIPLQQGTAELYASAARRKLNSTGGHDNLPALLQAWELAAPATNGVVVWIHGPQPIALASVEDLRQRFQRSAHPPRLLDVETQTGPERILENLDGLKAVRTVPRVGELGEDLGRLFGTWSGRTRFYELNRESIPAGVAGAEPPGREASLHLARLWAAGEVAHLSEVRRMEEAGQVAARHQLVTPVSGAVVLETQAQYQRAGLQPVTPESVPMVPVVPEPSTGALLLLAVVLLSRSLKRRARINT